VTARPAGRAPVPAVVLDCADPDALAGFWSNALGYRVAPAGHGAYVTLHDPAGRRPDLLLQRVPEPKSGKNRMHLDLRTDAVEPHLGRLRDLGASVLRGPFDDAGWLTTVLADPEGNEFCLIVPPGGTAPAPHWPPATRRGSA
jgi:predicted enzyme related to lactoylglutathione lyase